MVGLESAGLESLCAVTRPGTVLELPSPTVSRKGSLAAERRGSTTVTHRGLPASLDTRRSTTHDRRGSAALTDISPSRRGQPKETGGPV